MYSVRYTFMYIDNIHVVYNLLVGVEISDDVKY